jgi:hypothetical protein
MTQPATIDDRLRLALQSMFDAFAASSLYMMPWDYQVQKVNGGSGSPVTLDLQSTDPRMPNLAACPVWPGSDGSVAEPGVGATVMVVFSGGNPAKYRVVAMDPNTPPTKVHAPTSAVIPVALSTLVTANFNAIATTLGTGSNTGGPVVFATPFLPSSVAATVTEGL